VKKFRTIVTAAIAVAAPLAIALTPANASTARPHPVVQHCSSVFSQLGYDGFQRMENGYSITEQQTFFGLPQVIGSRHPAGCGLTYFPNSDTANNGKNALVTTNTGTPVSPNLALGAFGNRLIVEPANVNANSQDWVATQISGGPFDGDFTWTVGGKRVDVLNNGTVILVPNIGSATAGEASTFVS
jgi:hypothetical protein